VQKHRWGVCVLVIGFAALLLSGAGCTCYRTGHGWVLQPRIWSLEFKRMACVCVAEDCSATCAAPTVRESSCIKEQSCPAAASAGGICESNPNAAASLDACPAMRVGRLSKCAMCDRLAQSKGPGVEEKPRQPVIARFAPVPTQPVFCPRDYAAQPVVYEQIPKTQKAQESSVPRKKSAPKAPVPEEIPPPPEPRDVGKSGAAVPRPGIAAEEQSTWIFSPQPEKGSEQLIEAQLPPRPSERATR
jgi:hypothetical protein